MTTLATMTLIEFLLARIAEDEAKAHVLDWRSDVESLTRTDALVTDDGHGGLPAVAISRGRMLAECEAKRQIVESCREDYEYALTSGDDTTALATEVLMMLAAVYADHPDFAPEWRQL